MSGNTELVPAEELPPLVELYRVKRKYIALDEWLFYAVLIYMYNKGYPKWLIGSILFYGTLAIITSYKNITALEQRMGLKSWLFWPLC